MEALAFGVELTLKRYSKIQCAGHSERIRFVSEIVAGVESGARQPIQLCNNRALTQGHTRKTQTQLIKSARIPSQSMNPFSPLRGVSNTNEIANVSQLPHPVGNEYCQECQYESMIHSRAYRAGMYTRDRVAHKYKSEIINRVIRKAKRFLRKKSKLLRPI